MIKKLTLILIIVITLLSFRVVASDNLLEVEDFSSGYQVKKIPATQLHSLAKQKAKPSAKNLPEPASIKVLRLRQKQLSAKKTVTKKFLSKPKINKQVQQQNKQIRVPKYSPGSMSNTYMQAVEKAQNKVNVAPKKVQTHIVKKQPKAQQVVAKQKYVAPKPVKITPKIVPKQIAVTPIRKRKPVIVIDPGHGGKDPGAAGKLGTKEKNITLAYGLALKRELERTGRYKVVMTRSDDRFIELRDRVSIARKVGGDVMISIHADSNPNKTTRGFSVYTLSGDRAKAEAAKLLANADKEEVVRGAKLRGESRDVKEAIIDFAQDSTKDVSDDFAKTVAKSLGRRIQALKKHNREGSLAVLTGSDIPSVLIELGYLSNDYEERLLKREDHKQKMITSIRAAIDEYFSKFKMVF